MMQLLKHYKRRALLVGAIVVTLLALVVVIAPGNKPTTTQNASLGNLLGTGNRTAPGAVGEGSTTDAQIAAYQDKLRKAGDPATYASLGLAYLQKAREVGDPTYYTKAEAVLKKALESDPNNVEALGGMGSLALSRHQFAQGLEWGQKAQKLRPQMAYNYGVITDALVELGRYDEAAQEVQQMVNLRPDLSSYSRVSYVRELNGLYDGAIEAMQEAVQAGGPTGENVAYVTYQLGNLYFNHNNLTQAEAAFQNALLVSPNYTYAEAGMAKIKAARGDLNGAITLLVGVTQRYPLPEFIIELGDLYTLAGKNTEASRQYELVRGIQKIYSDNGVDTDLEMALFDADHEYSLSAALAKAKQVYSERPSIKAADALAWTLYKTGDYAAAAEMSKQALRLGTQDSLMMFHAGMIAAKQGQNDTARPLLQNALTLNPNFSFLYASTARETLAQLGGGVATK